MSLPGREFAERVETAAVFVIWVAVKCACGNFATLNRSGPRSVSSRSLSPLSMVVMSTVTSSLLTADPSAAASNATGNFENFPVFWAPACTKVNCSELLAGSAEKWSPAGASAKAVADRSAVSEASAQPSLNRS